MKLIDQSIRNYHTVTVIIVMTLVVGALCFKSLPRQLAPTVDKPQIEVKTQYRGLSPDEVERNIYINFVSPIKLIVKLAKLSSRLKIINISSGAANNPIHCWAPYCAAKSGMKSFLNVVELEDDISIFHVDPGVLDTNMQEEIRNHSQKCKNLEYFVGLKEDQKLRKASDAANEIYRDYIQ